MNRIDTGDWSLNSSCEMNRDRIIANAVNEIIDFLETHTVKEDGNDNYGKCSCDGKGICKKLGDVLKLILEVNWSEDVKLKEMDKVITEHYFTQQSNSEEEECRCTCQRCGKCFPCRQDSPVVEHIERECHK